jgi:hypothetical protein
MIYVEVAAVVLVSVAVSALWWYLWRGEIS